MRVFNLGSIESASKQASPRLLTFPMLLASSNLWIFDTTFSVCYLSVEKNHNIHLVEVPEFWISLTASLQYILTKTCLYLKVVNRSRGFELCSSAPFINCWKSHYFVLCMYVQLSKLTSWAIKEPLNDIYFIRPKFWHLFSVLQVLFCRAHHLEKTL